MRNQIIALTLLMAGPAFAASPEIKPSFDLRLRWERFDSPARNTATDPEYDLGLARFRAGLDLVWTRWRLHGMVQAGGVFNIPENGDGVKRRRLGDRLLGTFEWPNTARRFDGASFGYGPESTMWPPSPSAPWWARSTPPAMPSKRSATSRSTVQRSRASTASGFRVPRCGSSPSSTRTSAESRPAI